MKHSLFTPIIYSILGFFLMFSLCIIFATYIMRLKVETAVVSTTIETIVAPVNGYVTDIFVALGTQVKKGAPLIKIESLELERELGLARLQLEESELNIDYYQQLLRNEQQRLKIYQKIGQNRVISSQTFANIARQDVLTARHNLTRFTELYKKHFISKAIWETKVADYQSAREKLKNAEAQHRLENHSLQAVDKGMYFTGTKTEGIEQDLYAELDAAQKRAKLNYDRIKVYENLISKLTLIAPFDGKITQILKSAGNTTDNAKPLLFIENIKTPKHIIAYLTQNEVIHIGQLKEAKIYIPSSGKTYRGKIMEVNRTDGFIDLVKAQYQWRDFQIDRSAMVTIEVQQSDQKEFNKEAFSGMPAIVYFSKKFIL